MARNGRLKDAVARQARVSPEERRAIVEALRAGESAGSVARRTGRSQSTVSGIAKAEGVALDASALQKASAAKLTRDQAAALFDESRQLSVLAKIAAVAEERLDESQLARIKPLEMQQLATAVAIVVDKWRLIQGEATARTEVASQGAKERLAKRLDELAKRRQQAEAVTGERKRSEQVAS